MRRMTIGQLAESLQVSQIDPGVAEMAIDVPDNVNDVRELLVKLRATLEAVIAQIEKGSVGEGGAELDPPSVVEARQKKYHEQFQESRRRASRRRAEESLRTPRRQSSVSTSQYN